MKLKIKKDAGTIFIRNHYNGMRPEYCAPMSVREFADKISAIQGMTIDVETKYLWDNQFNTAPIEGISDTGLRILDFEDEGSVIEEIIDDVRPHRLKCRHCHQYLREEDDIHNTCWWCGK